MSEEKLPPLEETIKELEEKLQQLEKEKEEYLSGWKRAKSDLLQAQKKTEEQVKHYMLMANSALISDLLTILDSFDLALQAISANDKESPLGRGYYLVQTQLIETLRKYGLTVIEAAGQKFDPNLHEAIDTKKCTQANCDGQDDGLIVEVIARGYRLHGELLRPARVRVVSHD